MNGQWMRTMEDMMAAVAFAERNEHKTALRMMAGDQTKGRVKQQRPRPARQQDNRPQMRL